MGGPCCGCGDRRVYILFLSITVLQIVLTIARWVIDFLGPLWSMILTDFLNIVFVILGFSGGYAQIKNYLFTYIVWSLLWTAWNIFIICMYIPIHSLEMYKSVVLSLGTGGFSYWETRAPGCVPDWASENKLIVTNCMFDPRLMEFIQSGVQVVLSVSGVISAFIILCRHDFDGALAKKGKQGGGGSNGSVPNTVPSFLGSSSSSHGRGTIGSRMSARHRGTLSGLQTNGDSSDQVPGNEDRLRPMTPRRVKRRSARSIQSQKFGRGGGGGSSGGDQERPSTSRGATGGGAGPSSGSRSSLRSNNSSARRSHRSSKRKNHQFVSPVNRLIQQVQMDSETSHDEPGRYTYRDQGHINPVYVGPQSPTSSGGPHHAHPHHPHHSNQPPPPPRPPSARSSYSNYHPARLPASTGAHPNVFNLNQNIFTNGGFDMSTEYNMSQHSNTTSANLYEEDVNFLPDPNTNSNNPRSIGPPAPGTMNSTTTMALASPPASSNASSNAKIPNGFSFSFNPHPHQQQQQQQHQQLPPPHQNSNAKKINNNNHPNNVNHQSMAINNNRNVDNSHHQAFAYPLAHSPVSQESFPMWGISQPQSPVVQNLPIPAPTSSSASSSRVPPMKSPPYQNPPSFQPRSNLLAAQHAMYARQLQPHPTNSETVI